MSENRWKEWRECGKWWKFESKSGGFEEGARAYRGFRERKVRALREVEGEMKKKERKKEKRRYSLALAGPSYWQQGVVACPRNWDWKAAGPGNSRYTVDGQPTPGQFQSLQTFVLIFWVTPPPYLSQKPRGGSTMPLEKCSFEVMSLTMNEL